ncbi:RecX family transcriptional regulator [Piscibacillus salipiscarius]|uniref:RecX family transcriptional regulator n=1 Tax=Piscibacillus salipiscarius TaxID=299480 RepID=UPI00243677BA|nr:RecX family transcriptional regulator [Piscibacillus salipiscarius]
MKISKISTQKKNKQRYNVFVDYNGREEFAFGVHEDLLIRFNLRKGLELTDKQVREIKQQDAIYQYYTLSINYLSYRMRAKSEIAEYLKGKEATPEAIETVIHKLEEEKLVDDLQFSKAYVRTKMNTSTKGPNKIKQELILKKIPEAYVEEAMSEYSSEIEVEKVIKMLKKKFASSSRKNHFNNS